MSQNPCTCSIKSRPGQRSIAVNYCQTVTRVEAGSSKPSDNFFCRLISYINCCSWAVVTGSLIDPLLILLSVLAN
ncbi:hypothetical protein Pfo_010520 [Paulownia fortunei]|nr:hypothetical protein Pfo_010520 [Paulownia fortunei]